MICLNSYLNIGQRYCNQHILHLVPLHYSLSRRSLVVGWYKCVSGFSVLLHMICYIQKNQSTPHSFHLQHYDL